MSIPLDRRNARGVPSGRLAAHTTWLLDAALGCDAISSVDLAAMSSPLLTELGRLLAEHMMRDFDSTAAIQRAREVPAQ
jgi:hypothetical protein